VLSPDGSRVAFVRTDENARSVVVLELASGKNFGQLRAGDQKLRGIRWADNDRLMIFTSVTAVPATFLWNEREWRQLQMSNGEAHVYKAWGRNWRNTMKAVVLHEYGGPDKLKFEDNVPDPQVAGYTVLIAAAATSVNPIDWKVRSGARQKDFPLSFPAILGCDVSGVVRAVGANLNHIKPRDPGNS
jgi:hypothetical protein